MNVNTLQNERKYNEFSERQKIQPDGGSFKFHVFHFFTKVGDKQLGLKLLDSFTKIGPKIYIYC